MFAVYLPNLVRSWFGSDRSKSPTKSRSDKASGPDVDEFGDPIMGTEEQSIDPLIVERFNSASAYLPRVMKNLQRQDLMQFYGLYKQATEGPADPSNRPSMLDMKNRTKFDAWAELTDMSKEVAMKTYAAKMDYMGLGWDFTAPASSSQTFGIRPSRMAASTSESTNEHLVMQDKEAALFFASSKADDVELMAKLVSKRPELVIERDQHLGMTALHWAIDSGADKVVAFLLDNGAQVNAVDPEGNSALHFAACCHRHAAAQLLIARGADKSLRNEEGKTAAETCTDEPNLQRMLQP